MLETVKMGEQKEAMSKSNIFDKKKVTTRERRE